MRNPLSEALNDAVLRRVAGGQSYQRGLDCFSHGHVKSLEEISDSVRALVRGNQDYTVSLTADEGVLDYSCDCPVGSERYALYVTNIVTAKFSALLFVRARIFSDDRPLMTPG